MNNLLLSLNKLPEVDLSLLFAQQWLEKDGVLPQNAPLRKLPFRTFKWNERIIERVWKSVGYPKMDGHLSETDWMFSPVDTYFPVKSKKTAITIHDIQAFESNLPWSNSKEHLQFRKRWSLWIHKAVKNADLVFTVSEFSKNRLIELLGLPEQKVQVSGNAVDPTFINTIDHIPQKTVDFPYLAVIGGLRYKKGGSELLDLAKKMRSILPNYKLIIWGENDVSLQEKAREIGNIISLEMISDEEMISWMKGAHASIFLSWYEGFGIPALEAMACGVPVICSDQASLPEITGNAAFLVNPKESNTILDTIKQLEQGTLRKEMIAKGNQQMSKYCWPKCAQNVYKELTK